MNKKQANTLMVDDEMYICYSGPLPSSWQVLVRKDGNEAAYRPVFLASWDEQRQQGFDKFLLLPAPGCGERSLIQINIYRPLENATGADQNKSFAFPDMVCRCRIPATIQQEPSTRRILVTLLCTLEARPEEYRIAVTLPADAETTFQHLERAGSQARTGGTALLKMMEKQEEQLLAWARRDPRDEVYLYRVASKLFLGLQTMQERKFGKAEGHFRQAQDFDGADESEAYFFLALTLLWQRKAPEASGVFYDDCVDRCVRLPAFFSLWSDLCRHNSVAAYLAEVKRTHADQLGIDPDEEDWLDEGEQPDEDTPEAKERRVRQALLESLEYHYKVAEDEEGPFSAGNCLLSAAFCFLGQDYRGCLKHLQGISSSSFTGFSAMWAVWFWKAMASLELGRYREAKKFLVQAIMQRSPLDSIPPVLANPLLWGRERHRTFFDAEIQVLLARHVPALLAKVQK